MDEMREGGGGMAKDSQCCLSVAQDGFVKALSNLSVRRCKRGWGERGRLRVAILSISQSVRGGKLFV